MQNCWIIYETSKLLMKYPVFNAFFVNDKIAFYKNNKYDYNDCEYQIVADVALYQTVNTYATTFPTSYPNIDMGSEIHPDHLAAHKITIDDIEFVITHMMNR